MIDSLIDSIARCVSATLRTSIWVESGIRAPASSKAMIANATASSTSEKPFLPFISLGSRRKYHDSVVGPGRGAGPVLVDEVGRRGILKFEIVRESPRGADRAVQRAAGEHENRLLVVGGGRKIDEPQAGKRGKCGRGRTARAGATGSGAGRDRIVGLAVPLVPEEPENVRVRRVCVGKARQIARNRGKRKSDPRLVFHLRGILQP